MFLGNVRGIRSPRGVVIATLLLDSGFQMGFARDSLSCRRNTEVWAPAPQEYFHFAKAKLVARLFCLLTKHDSAVRIPLAGKAVCLLLSANKNGANALVFVFAEREGFEPSIQFLGCIAD